MEHIHGFGLLAQNTLNLGPNKTDRIYLFCCTVHLVDSLNITLPTNALIVCHLFLNNFFKTFFTAPTCFDSISLIIIREHI